MWMRKISSLGQFPYADERVEGDDHHQSSEDSLPALESGLAATNSLQNIGGRLGTFNPRVVATPTSKPHGGKSRKISRGRFTIRRSRKLATVAPPPPEIVVTPATPLARDSNLAGETKPKDGDEKDAAVVIVHGSDNEEEETGEMMDGKSSGDAGGKIDGASGRIVVVADSQFGERIDDKDESASSTPSNSEAEDEPSPLKNSGDPLRRKSVHPLRRNSISLPALEAIDLQALRQAHAENVEAAKQIQDSQEDPSPFCSIENMTTDAEEMRAMADEELARAPLRMPRKKSVSTLAELRMSDQLGIPLDSNENSNQNSITSINSLASLLREKMQMVPSMIKKQKKPNVDYKVRAFVTILFLIIVFLVGFAYVMYHQKILAKSYFEKVQFNKMKRSLRIYDDNGEPIISGELGITLRSDRVFPCHEDDVDLHERKGPLCLEWLYHARLYLDREDETTISSYQSSFSSNSNSPTSNLRCYDVSWVSISPNHEPTDCYEWNGPAHWLANETTDFQPFITGKNWGNVLKRYFINSKGAAILVSDATPLHVSLDDGKLCLKAKRDNFAFASSSYLGLEPVKLSYRICCAANPRELHLALAERSLWDGLKEEDIGVINSLLAEPVWQIAPRNKENLTEGAVYNYTEAVIALGFLKQGHVLISEQWQKNNGDLTLDTTRFQTMHETVDIMHRRGFRILLTVQPFISTESTSFAECLQAGYLVGERGAKEGVPALVRYGSTQSAAVLDATSDDAVKWFTEKLNQVLDKYKVDGFYLDYGTAEDMPPHYKFKDPYSDPDDYKTLLVERGADGRFAAVSGAIRVPKPPIFVALPELKGTWHDLRKVLPAVLSYGVIGYQFLIPGAVGGSTGLPDKELYIRWLQLATFLPVVKFAQLPEDFKDPQVLEIARTLTGLRQKIVTPLLKKYSKQALDVGLPLVRPFWLLEPKDSACLTLTDEFSVGEELIVAPILHSKATLREVYLPAGVWKDGIDGSLRKGSRWIHGYRVPLDQVAYFMRMPDNTRF